MTRHPEPRSQGLAALLSAAVADFQRASHADMVSLVLLDDASRRYYAPFVVGQPEDGLVESLADQSEQLLRYDEDLKHGKVPEEIHVRQYGSTVWLTVTRRTLVAANAPAEIDSTFVRRFRILSMVGIPLVVHRRSIGLVYLNYCAQDDHAKSPDPRVPEGPALAELERFAAEVAHEVADELANAERAALDGVRRLTELLTTPQSGGGDASALRRRLSIALSELLMATGQEGAIVYQRASQHGWLELVTANAPIAAPVRIATPEDTGQWQPATLSAVGAAAAGSGLEPTLAKLLGTADAPTGYLVILARDPLAAYRAAPAVDVLLQAAADLLAGALENDRLIGVLEHGNELLGALSRMSTAILQPGFSRQQVLEAVAQQLTDASVPEFDFHFATVVLIGERPDGGLAVRAAAGASTVESIRAAAVDGTNARPRRVPVWALDQERPLMQEDVLGVVATRWEPVVVGPASRPGEDAPRFVDGYAPGQLRLLRVPVLRSDGEVVREIPIAVVEDGSAPPLAPDAPPPFTLAADIFEANRHGELIRIFVPFGLDQRRRATGVLEVGYVRSSDRRPDRTQVEALRAAGSQIAVAVDTARLYEDARRHAEQLEVSSEVSKAIASSIDFDQTLRLVARNLVRLVDASLCQIALYDEDTSGWFGAAASAMEREWSRLRGERVEEGFLFEALNRGEPLVIEDVAASDLVPERYKEAFGVRSLVVVPLLAGEEPIGAAILGQQDRTRRFKPDELQLAQSLGHQAAVAIKNARLHALSEDENHIQKDFLLLGFGMWGQKAYEHLLTLKQFFNFRIHVVERAEAKERLAAKEQEVLAAGDLMYWDSQESPAHEQLDQALETSCYVITYIATPAATHLPALAQYYGLSDVMMIEKPLGASPEAYRNFLATVPGGVEIVAADHYYFKLEVRLLQLLLTEERTLRDFMDSVDEVKVEILEARPLVGAAADIGVVADLIPHAFAIVSLLTPVDRIQLDPDHPLLVGRHEPFEGERETYARMQGTYQQHGRTVKLVIDVGKGVDDQKWIKVSGERRHSGRANFYKFDFSRGEAIDGTQGNVRSAVRKIREPGVPDNAHLTMLRHVIEKRHPAVGILSIREAIRSNQRIQELETMALDLLEAGECTSYRVGQRPAFAEPPVPEIEVDGGAEPRPLERERARHG
ncbi:MAG: GAF domain-containing protein [Candidatus Dormiibacterota bacterium]